MTPIKPVAEVDSAIVADFVPGSEEGTVRSAEHQDPGMAGRRLLLKLPPPRQILTLNLDP